MARRRINIHCLHRGDDSAVARPNLGLFRRSVMTDKKPIQYGGPQERAHAQIRFLNRGLMALPAIVASKENVAQSSFRYAQETAKKFGVRLVRLVQ